MAQRVVAAVFAVVGLYLDLWHSAPLPFNHFQVFGRGFGAQHSVHSAIGLILIVAAYWLWTRARATSDAADDVSDRLDRVS
ncbi:MAG: hypothetical protein KGN00_03070 [Chloroflexota bacterium]|nr:hypothetical protein [Chloroflexota bacterium]MDE3192647.1 hypothetical protein [Chloroflexota bacterium]